MESILIALRPEKEGFTCGKSSSDLVRKEGNSCCENSATLFSEVEAETEAGFGDLRRQIIPLCVLQRLGNRIREWPRCEVTLAHEG